jgi:hypothetical protein
VAENQAPDISDFCVLLNEAPEGAGVIRFYGGLSLQSTGDPTRGTPGSCALSVDLIGNVQAALAPLAPLLTILDAVAGIAQCLQLAIQVQTNPFKLPDLIACVPGLIGKVNKLLGLIPIFPQGILSMLEMCLDILNFILTQIDCLLNVLVSIQNSIDELQELVRKINETDDVDIRENLKTLFDCGMENAQTQATTAMSAFSPLARLICTVRFLVSLVPGGSDIAGLIGIPEPSSLVDLTSIIALVRAARDVIQVAVDAITLLGSVVGLGLPETTFTCPPQDTVPSFSEEEEIPEPVIQVIDPTTGLPLTSIPAAPGPGEYMTIWIVGAGLLSTSKVYWSTVEISADDVDDNGTPLVVLNEALLRLEVQVSSELYSTAGFFFVSVANGPSGEDAAFAGLADEAGGEMQSEIMVSNLVEIEVT